MVEGGGKEKANDSPSPVFISYASQDAAVAAALVEALERRGIVCWIAPRDVKAGALYADAIVRAISGAKGVVLVLSEGAIASSHVSKEIERASSKRRPIIALRIDAAPLTPALEYFLSESQWVEAQAGNIDAAVGKLVDAIGEPAATAPGSIVAATRRVSAGSASATHLHSRRNRFLLAAGLAVVTVALAALLANRFWLAKHAASEPPLAAATLAAAITAPAISDKSVAVLPFVDMSQKKDQEYFSDGLSEELIDRLAHSPDLKIIARTSSFQFKGSKDDVRTIGRKLGVANVLEGSVRTSGKTLRVTAQLINASDGSHRWSETYDRDVGDVFKVQDSIAEAVVTALKAVIAVPTASVRYKPTSTDAYNAFLRGNYFLRKYTKQDTDRALASFEEAIRLDPRYADAWARIADAHNQQGLNFWITPTEAYAKARDAIDHALSIDPNCADAYAALGQIEVNFRFDHEKSKAAFDRARELDPAVNEGDSEVWDALSAGRLDEAIALSLQLVQRDPLNAERVEDLAYALWVANRLPEAESTLQRLLELDSGYSGAHCELGDLLLSQHRPEVALAIMSEEADQDNKWCVTHALWAVGRRTEADAFLTEVQARHADTQALQIARSYALRGDKDEAFQWLDRAYDNRESMLYVVRQDPMLRSLRDDPRFNELVHKLKLPE
jgi:TolB-like protein/thioredoxin-like negative regulator of GroEL